MRGNRTVKVSAGSLHAFDSPNLPPLARAHVDIDVDQGTVLRPASMARFRVVDTVCQEVPSCLGLWNGYLHDCTGGDAADLPLDHGEHRAALPAAAGARRGAAVLRGRQHPLRQDTPHTPTHGYHTHCSYFNTEAVPRYHFYTQPPILVGCEGVCREDLLAALREGARAGVIILVVTQCSHGGVSPDYETGQALLDTGAVPGSDITQVPRYIAVGVLNFDIYNLITLSESMKN